MWVWAEVIELLVYDWFLYAMMQIKTESYFRNLLTFIYAKRVLRVYTLDLVTAIVIIKK